MSMELARQHLHATLLFPLKQLAQGSFNMLRMNFHRQSFSLNPRSLYSQANADPELKLPKFSSLAVIITSNLLLQVSQYTQMSFVDLKPSSYLSSSSCPLQTSMLYIWVGPPCFQVSSLVSRLYSRA